MNLKRCVLIYSPLYNLDLGTHVFPAQKYFYLYNMVKKDPQMSHFEILQPEKARMEDLELVHTFSYLEDLFSYEHTFRTIRSELPLNRSIVESIMTGVGGTVLAMEKTSEYRFCLNLGGGFHHSMPDHAEGFCYLNDVAIATKLFLYHNPEKKVLIIDLDLHQGNGNAYIFRDDAQVFTFSMHQENIYPKKEKSSLDVPLEPGTQDREYQAQLESSLQIIEANFHPDLVFYIAGADPYENDMLGGLRVTMEGLIQRDRLVRNFCLKLDSPMVMVTAGGYAIDPMDTVRIHYNTVKVFATENY